MEKDKKKDILLLVDGNALIHRGFHAIPHLSTKKGEPTNGVYGFTMLFLRAIKELAPRYVAVAFDLPGKTFRDDLYEPYKAHRVAAPAELYAQIPRVKELVQAMNVPVFELENYEADDLIGSLAELGKQEKNLEVFILTGDRDAVQLVDDHVKVLAPVKGVTETILYDRQAVKEKYGLDPEQIVDYKALRGDASDNIPGVKGVGEKTATELLQKYKNLSGIYEAITPSLNPSPQGGGKKGEEPGEGIKPRVAELLLQHRQDAEISQKLAQIVRDLPLELDLNQAELSDYDTGKVVKMFQELEFRSLIDKLPKAAAAAAPAPVPEKSEILEAKYELVDSKSKYDKLVKELKHATEIAIDTETTSLYPVQADLLGLGLGWEQGKAFYVLKDFVGPELVKVLEDPEVKKIGHNIKYDYLVLKNSGIKLAGLAFDTMIAAYLLNPGARVFDLDSLSFNEFGIRKIPITDLIGTGKNEISMSAVEPAKVAAYCGEDVDCTWRLKQVLEKELAVKHLEKIFYEIDMPLIPVLAEMEYSGIKIDTKFLKKLSGEAEKEAAKIQAKIWKLAGEEFNIGSPLQLKKKLFEKLEIPTEKLKNTYLDALPGLIYGKTGRLHTSFNQTIAATGRLSSSDPNLQNIPIRTELGREVRKAFVAEKGFKLVSIDYSQIELRLAAHLSEDPKMMKVFREGGDIHLATAQEIFGIKNPEDVTADMRRQAKTINFGVLYGLSAYGLTARIPGVSQANARDFIDRYFETYKKLSAYLDDVVAETKRRGYVKNELGRLRFLPEINSSQFQVRSAAERAALNMPFQSLSADIIKMAMNK